MSRLALLLVLSVSVFVCEAKIRSGAVRVGSNPGICIRLNRGAMDSLFKNTASVMSTYAHKLPIPDASATVGGTDIQTKNIRIKDFKPPQIRFRFMPPSGLVASLKLPLFRLEGPFKAARRTFVNTQTDQGNVSFSAQDIVVNISATIGEYENGSPKIEKFECASSLGAANLNVQGCKEKFPVETMGLAAKTIRPFYNTQVCSAIKKFMTININSFLGKLPNVIEVNPFISFRFQIKPAFGADHFEGCLHGKTITDHVSPFTPAPFAVAPCEKADAVVLLSDAVFNDALWQAHTNKKFELTISPNSHPLLYDLVRVECESNRDACLGNVAPDLKTKYGSDAFTRCEFRSTKAPEVQFNQGKATFTAALVTELFFTTRNDSQEFLEATASVEIIGSVQIKITNGSLFGKVSVDNVTVHIDEEHNKKWEDKVHKTIKEIVEQRVNGDLLLKGVPLKLPFGAGLDEPTVSFQKNTCQIYSGFVMKTEEITSAELKSREQRN